MAIHDPDRDGEFCCDLDGPHDECMFLTGSLYQQDEGTEGGAT